MREESGKNLAPLRDAGKTARRTSAPPRPRQSGFPFWVLRGPSTRGPQKRRATSTSPTSPKTGRQQGRTGVDLRAAAGAPRRDPRTTQPPAPPKRRALWRRAAHRSTPLATAPTVARTLAPHKPKRRRIRIHYGLALLVLAQVAILGLLTWGLTSPTWQVRHVQVTGTQDATLAAAIQQLPLTGCNIFRCDTARQTRLVESLPAVASATVHAAYPDGLIVVVTARQPALLWHAGGQDVVIARDGTVLGPPDSDPAYTQTALPQVSDDASAAFGGQPPQPGAKLSPVIVEMAGQLRNGMAAALGGDGWTLRYTAASGFVAAGPNGRQVVFGMPDDAASVLASSLSPAALGSTPSVATVDAGVQTQLAELRGLNTLLANQGQSATLIDLRWGTHPYYRTDG